MIDQNSLAAGNLVTAQNVQFEPSAQVLQRKIVIIGTYDSTKTGITDNVPERFFSAGAIGDKYGFGSMIHRLAIKAFLGSRGLETWVIPQPEAGGAVVAAGDVAFTGTATSASKIGLYIAGEKYSEVNVAIGDTHVEVSDAILAAMTDTSNPTSGASALGVLDLTAKSKGPYGNAINISLNLADDEDLPAGITAVVTAMAGGAANPDIQDALDAMGTDDSQNEKYFTALIHGYGQDATVLDALSAYNGEGNDFVGNYAKTVARPFRSLFGDTAAGDGGLLALIAFADANLLDRTNGVIAAPGSQNHPEEIAALALGVMELINTTRAEQTYIDEVLAGIRLGANADRWTNKYDNRDTAVKAGISPTLVKNNALTLQNVVSFYRPAAVAPESNGYRSMRNISILQNILFNQKNTFEQPKWKGTTIVSDVTKVTNITSRLKARDVDAVLDELLSLATLYEGFAWLFSASFTIEKLKEGDKVTLRVAGNGFDIQFPIILSGEGGILNQVVQFDTSLAVFL